MILNILDGIVDDIKAFCALILIAASTLFLSGNEIAVEIANNHFFIWSAALILFFLVGFDLIVSIIDMIVSIFTQGFFSSIFHFAFYNILPLTLAFYFSGTLENNFQIPEDAFMCILLAIYSVITVAFSFIEIFIPDEDDLLDRFEGLVELVRLLSIIFVIVTFYSYNLKLPFANEELFNAAFKIANIVLAVDILIWVIDFIAGIVGGLNFGDLFTFVLNAILAGSVIYACSSGKSLLPIIGEEMFTLTSFSELFVFGFLVYVFLEILISIPLNLLSNIGGA